MCERLNGSGDGERILVLMKHQCYHLSTYHQYHVMMMLYCCNITHIYIYIFILSPES